jgi:hypothetical protein
MLVGVVIAEVMLVVYLALSEPTFLPAVEQTPGSVALGMLAFGGVMYCVTSLQIWWHYRIRSQRLNRPWTIVQIAVTVIGLAPLFGLTIATFITT